MNSDEIRRLVRAALTEALGSPDKDDGAIAVTIGSDAELMAFAREVAANAKAVKSGKITYRLARSQTKPTAGGGGGGGGEGYRWEHGVLNEVRIIEISKTHSRVLLGPGAVVTPLARDKARQVKLELVPVKSNSNW